MIIHGIDLGGWLQITCEQSNSIRPNKRVDSSEGVGRLLAAAETELSDLTGRAS